MWRSARLWWWSALILGPGLLWLFSTAFASARVSFESPYTQEQTYNAALRLVRVDLGFNVTEKDPKAAYVLFDYKSGESGSKTTPGSIEVIGGAKVIRVVVQLAQMPRYHEQIIADALTKKMHDDYGEPPPPPPPPPPPAPSGSAAPDGGVPDAP